GSGPGPGHRPGTLPGSPRVLGPGRRLQPRRQPCGLAGSDGKVKLWDARAGGALASLPGHAGIVYCLAFRPDGKTLASAGNDGVVKICDTQTGQELHSWRGHEGVVTGLAFRGDGKLVSAALDQQVKVWDGATGKYVTTWHFLARVSPFGVLAVSP